MSIPSQFRKKREEFENRILRRKRGWTVVIGREIG